MLFSIAVVHVILENSNCLLMCLVLDVYKCQNFFWNKYHWQIAVPECARKRTGETAREWGSLQATAPECQGVPTPIISRFSHCLVFLALSRSPLHSSHFNCCRLKWGCMFRLLSSYGYYCEPLQDRVAVFVVQCRAIKSREKGRA